LKRINSDILFNSNFMVATPIFTRGNIYVCEGVDVSPHVDTLSGNIYLEDFCKIESCRVEDGNIYVGNCVLVRNCLAAASPESRKRMDFGTIVLGDNCTIIKQLAACGGIEAGDSLSVNGITSYYGTCEIGHNCTSKGIYAGNSVVIGNQANVRSVCSQGEIIIGDDCVIDDVYAKGNVKIGRNAKIGKIITLGGSLHIGNDSSVESISAYGDITMGRGTIPGSTLVSFHGTIKVID